ncbi:hypothetical protein LTR36_007439 [Oleoguttula mirabilis]|uniref:Uncharacterized protein n=1 Tax=Oleoguttula mirabilis TaxID=1507867 RepID=A0AAV9JA61_9PEZI|nr:hypothetical protein LTR36_007439 [Oleoguttula mirabilis]
MGISSASNKMGMGLAELSQKLQAATGEVEQLKERLEDGRKAATEARDGQLRSLLNTFAHEATNMRDEFVEEWEERLQHPNVRADTSASKAAEMRESHIESLKSNYGLHYAQMLNDSKRPGASLPGFTLGGEREQLFPEETVDSKLLLLLELARNGNMQRIFAATASDVPTMRLPPLSAYSHLQVLDPTEIMPVQFAARFQANGSRVTGQQETSSAPSLPNAIARKPSRSPRGGVAPMVEMSKPSPTAQREGAGKQLPRDASTSNGMASVPVSTLAKRKLDCISPAEEAPSAPKVMRTAAAQGFARYTPASYPSPAVRHYGFAGTASLPYQGQQSHVLPYYHPQGYQQWGYGVSGMPFQAAQAPGFGPYAVVLMPLQSYTHGSTIVGYPPPQHGCQGYGFGDQAAGGPYGGFDQPDPPDEQPVDSEYGP